MRFNLLRQICINLWNVASTLNSPKGMQLHSKKLQIANGKGSILFRCLLHFNLPKLLILGPGKKNDQLLPDSLMPLGFLAKGGSLSLYRHWDGRSLYRSIGLRPSFLTNTTALHHALWLGHMAPESTISCRWLQTSPTKARGICLNLSLKGVSSITLIMCSVEWVQPSSLGSNEKTSWYLARRNQVQNPCQLWGPWF